MITIQFPFPKELPGSVFRGLKELMPVVQGWLESDEADIGRLVYVSVQERAEQNGAWVFKLHFNDDRIRVFPFRAIPLN